MLERETTHDVDVVNELPEAIRTEYALVDELARRYKLRMTHFASHYLPDGYERRARSIGAFNQLDARLVDPIDVLTGKLFSKRPKDLDDIRAALPKIDLDSLRDRVRTTTGGLRGERDYLERGTQNWYIPDRRRGTPELTVTRLERESDRRRYAGRGDARTRALRSLADQK